MPGGRADHPIVFLVNVGKFDVVERQQLQKIIDEHHLGSSGLLDGAAIGKIGKILGVYPGSNVVAAVM